MKRIAIEAAILAIIIPSCYATMTVSQEFFRSTGQSDGPFNTGFARFILIFSLFIILYAVLRKKIIK